LPLINNAEIEKPIVVIVPSYNNGFWYMRNLNSICAQNYSNYRVIYINDASPDETGTLVKQYIEQNKLENRITLINNEERKGCPLANIYHALSFCKPEEIAVLIDGDDWLPHENVFAHLNRVYQDTDVWMTYGQFAVFPSDTIGWARQVPDEIIQENAFRSYYWCTTHLRSFYVSLFNATAYSDYMYEDRFFPMAGDLALTFPLLELAGTHSRFIPEALYIYNRANALNEDKVNKELQKSCEMAARAHHRYNPLESL
jgi:glycosyltransferase involved in cell wall biosynthesis